MAAPQKKGSGLCEAMAWKDPQAKKEYDKGRYSRYTPEQKKERVIKHRLYMGSRGVKPRVLKSKDEASDEELDHRAALWLSANA